MLFAIAPVEFGIIKIAEMKKGGEMQHSLKCWPEFFHQTFHGRKRFELRRNDRDFKVGDELLLKEWDPQGLKDNLEQEHRTPEGMKLAYGKAYTGREVLVRVDYIIKVEDFVICGAIMDIKAPDYVIMSVSLVPF